MLQTKENLAIWPLIINNSKGVRVLQNHRNGEGRRIVKEKGRKMRKVKKLRANEVNIAIIPNTASIQSTVSTPSIVTVANGVNIQSIVSTIIGITTRAIIEVREAIELKATPPVQHLRLQL